MQYFLDTVETIPDGVGFSHYGVMHLAWLIFGILITIVNCIWYRHLGTVGRKRWKRIVALLIVCDEMFKMAMLAIGGRYKVDYLPFHLCSVNILIIAIHAWRPTKIISGFLYTVCITRRNCCNAVSYMELAAPG